MRPIEGTIWFFLVMIGIYWVVSVHISSLDARRLPKRNRISWAIVTAVTLISFISIWCFLVETKEDAYYASFPDQMMLVMAAMGLVMTMIICWMGVARKVRRMK